MKTPGFLFDMDGVLIDSRQIHFDAWNKVIPMSNDDFIATFGMTNAKILSKMFPDKSAQWGVEIADKKEAFVREISKTQLKLLPGMEAFLIELKESNYPRIIASNTPKINLEFYVANTPIGKYFDMYVSGEEVKNGKPHPDVYIEAAHRLNLDPKECIVIEDSPHGLEAGKDAGCFVIALATTNPEHLLHPKDHLFNSPLDLSLNPLLDIWNQLKLPC